MLEAEEGGQGPVLMTCRGEKKGEQRDEKPEGREEEEGRREMKLREGRE